MNIKIEVSFSEAQKAQIVSRNEQISTGFVELEVSNKYINMLSKFRGNYVVSNESVQINKNVEYYDDQYYHNISNNVSIVLASGVLQVGGSVNSMMKDLADIIETHEQRKRDNEIAKAIDKKNYIRDAPVRAWEISNRAAIRAHTARVEAEYNAKTQAKADKIKAEKLDWINQHGSERLRGGVKQGYNCQKIYTYEKGNMILGHGYEFDYEGDVSTKERSCPSMAALVEVNHLNKKAIDPTIVWLPNGLHQLNDPNACDDTYDYESCEAVEVRLDGLQGYWYKIF